jgi:hypothetical protein
MEEIEKNKEDILLFIVQLSSRHFVPPQQRAHTSSEDVTRVLYVIKLCL